MNAIVNLSRRGFLKAGISAGGGLLLGFHVPGSGRLAVAASAAEQAKLNSWVRIAERHRHHYRRPVGDGTGRDDVDSHDHRR